MNNTLPVNCDTFISTPVMNFTQLTLADSKRRIFLAKIGQIIACYPLPFGVGAPCLGNPGSAIDWYTFSSWGIGLISNGQIATE